MNIASAVTGSATRVHAVVRRAEACGMDAAGKRGIMRRFGVALLAMAAGVALMAPSASLGQGTGEFLCSAGSRDGQSCLGFSDCPGGVCVIAQGVCSNGDVCVCPGGGQCVATPACSIDASFGTCAGGVAAGVCCALGFNCPTGDSCAATHKICLSGPFQGFPCTTNAMCEGGTCGSNGYFCDNGDADGYPCVTNADCPGGICETGFVTQPTNTPGTTQQVRTPTPTVPGATPAATNTAPAPPTLSPGVVPTATPVETATATAPTPTSTPVIGTLLTTTQDAFAGDNKIVVDIDAADLSTFPVEGVVEIAGVEMDFTRRRSSRTLDLRAVNGLPANVPAGSIVRVIEFTPTPGPIRVEDRAIEEGCAVRPAASGDRGILWLVGAAMLAAGLRRRHA